MIDYEQPNKQTDKQIDKTIKRQTDKERDKQRWGNGRPVDKKDGQKAEKYKHKI